MLTLKQPNIFSRTYRGVPLVQQLAIALERMYSLEASNLRRIPEEYNPVFFHYSTRQVDPLRIDPQDREYNAPEKLWEPLKKDGMKKTRERLAVIKQFYDEHKNRADNPLDASCIITREHKGNQVTIGMFHLDGGRYERYFIRDLKKVCKLLRKTGYDFARVFGQAEKLVFCNEGVSDEEIEKKLSGLVVEDHTEITNEHILEIIRFFKPDNVVRLVS
jgi:hypothetical protein